MSDEPEPHIRSGKVAMSNDDERKLVELMHRCDIRGCNGGTASSYISALGDVVDLCELHRSITEVNLIGAVIAAKIDGYSSPVRLPVKFLDFIRKAGEPPLILVELAGGEYD
jgi:hypothetical protein